MATIEDGIFSLLNQSAAIQTVLAPDAGGTNCRLYPGTIAEEATLPAAAFARVAGSRFLTMSGPENLTHARFQFSVASTLYDDCTQIMEIILSLLHGFSGQLPNGVVVQQARVVLDPVDQFTVEARLYARHADIEFVYNAA